MPQRLARIGLDGLYLSLAAGHQLVLEPRAIGPVRRVGRARRAYKTGVSAITSETRIRVGGGAIRRKSHPRRVPGPIDFVIPVDPVNRVVRHQFSNDADDVLLRI